MGRTDLDQRADEHPAAGDEGSGERAEARRIGAAQRGAPGAFDELVRDHYARVYACAFRLVGNHEDAEDLAQECFVRAHGALAWYRGQGSLSGWLRRIVVHLAHDRFRAAGRRPEDGALPLERGELTAEPSSQAGAQELARVLDEALRRLPAHQRIPLVLRTLEGLDYEEIASVTGVTPATARTQVMKARRALRRLLAPYLREDEA